MSITLTHTRVPPVEPISGSKGVVRENDGMLLREVVSLFTNSNSSAGLPEGRPKLIAAPLTIQGCNGAPARIPTILPDPVE